MEKISHTIISTFLFLGIVACDKKSVSTTDTNIDEKLNDSKYEVKNFIWRVLNDLYLWKDDVDKLDDNLKENSTSYLNLLDSEDTPSDFFNSLLYQKDVVDRFSFLSDNYTDLENRISGIQKTTGMNIGLTRISNNSDEILAYVKYVVKGSDADKKNVKRGDLFSQINGETLTIDNFGELLANETYTINFLEIQNHLISGTGESVTLTKTEIQDNPIYESTVIDIEGKKVGYLMFNGFYRDYDKDLNNVFLDFKNQGVSDLVLDLRYNGGGFVSTALYLAGMITGQFNGEVFYQQIWNNKYNTAIKKETPSALIEKFVTEMEDGTALNSLNLNRLYVIALKTSASASELLMNGLAPYINVVHIGTKTYGKYTASSLFYDSPNLRKADINPNHKYALQPIIFKSANADGYTDYNEGLTPIIGMREDLVNLGTIGDKSEPLLSRALQEIESFSARRVGNNENSFYSNDLTVPEAILYISPNKISTL